MLEIGIFEDNCGGDTRFQFIIMAIQTINM